MLLVALLGHDYDNKWRSPGDVYDAKEPYAQTLVTIGMAKYAPADQSNSLPAASEAPRNIGPQPEIPVSKRTGKPKRKYERRDMVPKK